MKILSEASTADLQHLLELFPIANLKEAWPQIKGHKKDFAHEVAKKQPVKEIVGFIADYFTCCKQHVYVFSHKDKKLIFPHSIAGGEKVSEVADSHSIYVFRTTFEVILADPPEKAKQEFLWPVLVESTTKHLIVKFVVLERSLGAYFKRAFHVHRRNMDEKAILKAFTDEFNLASADLHKGVKKLWADDYIDGIRVDYKKPMSMSRESMDQGKGIKEHYPNLYKELKDAPLFNSVFCLKQTKDKNNSVSIFVADPPNGYIAFLRYTAKSGDTDLVIREILKHN